ncbi:MAG: DUF177 domain-containing protein [Kiritimatiellae bacterium]|nr:DUF177 domain-containing protein [Kiritimatiellia bacterium]
MVVPLSRLGPDGAVFTGEDPVETLEWPPGPRDVVRPAGPMRWRVEARMFGSELVCTGHAEARFEGVCCRCGGPLDRTFGDDFSLSREVRPDETEADLTSDLRETILLALPNHPVCSDDCPGPPAVRAPGKGGGRKGEGSAAEAGAGTGDSGPWAALDSIFGGTTHDTTRPRTKKTEK